MQAPRTIVHVDLDAFFAAVEQRDDPSLRGRPVVVGGSVRRGVVAAASYEARRFGVRSAMPMAEALRRCPQAVVVPHRMERYVEASRGLMTILAAFSPLVEALSLDEAFLDVTGCRRLLGDGRAIAGAIKRRVTDELRLVASVGVAPSKFVAKVASDIDKPDGLRVVEPAQVRAFLHPLPASRLWGVGDATRAQLERLGLTTIGAVAAWPEDALRARLGAALGSHLWALAQGHDPRPVEPERAPRSVGHRQTFEDDVTERGDLEVALLLQADRVAARLRDAGLRARAAVLTVRHDDRRQWSRRRALPTAGADGRELAHAALAALGDAAVDDRPGQRVRLVGLSATDLEPRDAPRQLQLGEPAQPRGERLGDALDEVRRRFGAGAVKRAVHLDDG